MQKEKSLSRNKDVNKWGVIYKKPSGECLTAGGVIEKYLIFSVSFLQILCLIFQNLLSKGGSIYEEDICVFQNICF